MKPLLAGSKILMRMHRWHSAAMLLSAMPLSWLDGTARGRLSYALLMMHRTDAIRAKRILLRVLKKNGDLDPAMLLELATMAVRVQDEPLARKLLSRCLSRGAQDATADAARKLLMLHASLANGTLPVNLAGMVNDARIPSDGMLTLVPVSSRYLELWSLWIEQVRKHIDGTVVAIVMDDAVLAPLRAEAGVAIVDARDLFAWTKPGSLHDVSRGVLWQLRTLLLHELVNRGRTVLVLDLDAIAIGDVQPLLDGAPDADVIAQKDHSLSMDVNRQLGFVLCCGFMLWRPTNAASMLLERFVAEAMVERDDQLALNHILRCDGIASRTEAPEWMCFTSGGTSFACPDPALVSRTLHSGTVVRHFQQEGHSVPELRSALGL